jgi:hypothetical protein
MPPTGSQQLLPIGEGPRVIVYHQTHHLPDSDTVVSLLPLITSSTGITHVIIAAIHLNDNPEDITLNDNPPSHEKFNTLWSEVAWLQGTGIKILGMLGGAARGSYDRLDGDDEKFERFYSPLRDMIKEHDLDGLDLDVEEKMSLGGMIRLIDRLRSDFGTEFIITLAPVATALLPAQPHLSGFSYHDLERARGREVAWYNAQFYCGWGDASTTMWYDAIINTPFSPFPPNKVVMGLITNSKLGAGYVEWEKLEPVLRSLRARYASNEGFGGVMGWEYFCAMPGEEERPWEWVENISRTIRTKEALPAPVEELSSAPASQQVPMGPFGSPLPLLQQPFPMEKINFLAELGFNQQQAVMALNMTEGDIDRAAGLLFDL